MSDAERAMVAIAAKLLAQFEDEGAGLETKHVSIGLLVLAMMLDCGGKGDCEDCRLSGLWLCVYEQHSESSHSAAA